MSVPHRPPGPPPGPTPGPVPGDAAGEPAPRRAGVLAVTAALLLVADLVSKVVVVAELLGRAPVRLLGGALYLTHARNSGAAFGFAEGATVLFTGVAAVVVVVIVRTAAKLRSLPWAICLGLILGGAAGNLVDRLFRSPAPLRGHVVDWISVFDPYGRVFPIFNLADSGIVVGGILAVLLAVLGLELDGTRGRGRSDATRPDPTRPDPIRPGPTRPDPTLPGAAPDGPPGTAARSGHPPAHPRHPGVPGNGYVPSAGPLAGPAQPAAPDPRGGWWDGPPDTAPHRPGVDR